MKNINYESLSVVRKLRERIYNNIDLIEEKLKENDLPNNFIKIEEQLKKLSSQNGKFTIDFKITFLDLFLIFGSQEYRNLKDINFCNIDLKFKPDNYRHVYKHFNELFDCDCPDEFVMIYDLIHKVEYLFEKNIKFDLELLPYNYLGLSTFIFSKVLPDNVLCIDNNTYSPINYYPFSKSYASSLTYGLIYDFYAKKFKTGAYIGDFKYNALESLFMSFLSRIEHNVTRSDLYECYDFSEESADDFVDLMTSCNYEFDDLSFVLIMSLANYLGCNYLTVNSISKSSVLLKDYYRYANFYDKDDFEQKKSALNLFNIDFPDSYMFTEILPYIPIPFNAFYTTKTENIDNWLNIVKLISSLYNEMYGSGLFAKERYADLKKEVKTNSQDVFNELKEFFKENRFSKKNKNIIIDILKNTLSKIELFTVDEIKNGHYGYAFIAIVIFWDNSSNNDLLLKLAIKIMEKIDKEIIPQFILDTVKQCLPQNNILNKTL